MTKREMIVICVFSLLAFFASAPLIAEEECQRSGGENGEYCKACKWSWWYWQDTCQDVEYSAYCSCETGPQDCENEEGDCDYDSGDCAGIPGGECPEHP
jgi:hypothetical protein